MREVSPERNGWRDEGISRRHRSLYGFDCPMLDIDFLTLEYNYGRPTSIIELKHENARLQYSSHPSYQALIHLGNNSKIPVYNVRYENSFSKYRVTPLNQYAHRFTPDRIEMTEVEYVSLLYRLRGTQAPKEVLEKLNS